MVSLIANTTTKTGLKVRASLDTGQYPTGRTVSEKEMRQVNIESLGPHDGWAYAIKPRLKK